MNSERNDVDWASSRVIGGIDDVLKVHASQHVLNHGSVVIDLANALR
jgi:hypothetical protein